MELLDFARGPALTIAFAIFAIGVAWRLSSLLFTPRPHKRAEAREGTPSDAKAFVRGVFSRFIPHKTYRDVVFANHLNAYVFHIGLFIVVFLYRPHILFIEGFTGLSWPALPNTLVYGVGLVTVVSLGVALARRMTNPVQKILTTFDDYFSWALTVLPVLTGLLVVNGIGARYETLLALHILSVCALLIWLPFGKLMHTFLFVLSRGVTSVRLSRRGATF